MSCYTASEVKSDERQTPKKSIFVKQTTFISTSGKNNICSVKIKNHPIQHYLPAWNKGILNVILSETDQLHDLSLLAASDKNRLLNLLSPN